MRALSYFIVAVLLLAVQSTFGVLLQIGAVKPDFILTLVLCVALIRGENGGALYGLAIGLLEDIVYGNFLGFNALVKFLTGYAVGYGTRDLFKGPVVFTMSFVFVGTLLYNLIFLAACWVFIPGYTSSLFLQKVVSSALYNALLGPFMYAAVVKLERFLNYYFETKY